MVMQLGPIVETLRNIPQKGEILLLSPGGEEFSGKMARQLAERSNITLICGRYEGIDARISEFFSLRELRVGSVILNGGETAALAIIEAVSRFVPGFLGSEESTEDESFSGGLIEYPHFTRPAVYEGSAAPEILLSGNHAQIYRWRRKAALEKTLKNAPDSLEKADLNAQDIELLRETPRKRIGQNLSFCLFHYPVKLERNRIGASSLTNMDLHDISRISQSYGLGPLFVLTPLEGQLRLVDSIVRHWTRGPGGRSNPDRRLALASIISVRNLDELYQRAEEIYGRRPILAVTSAQWKKGSGRKSFNCLEIRELLRQNPVIMALGTAKGLVAERLGVETIQIQPIRFLNYNHLSVRSAAAIIADRILGDFY